MADRERVTDAAKKLLAVHNAISPTDSSAMVCPRCRGFGKISAPTGLAARIGILRDIKGCTGAAIEKGTGLSHATLHRIMHGGTCTTDSLVRLADFFEVSTDDLLGRRTQPEQGR